MTHPAAPPLSSAGFDRDARTRNAPELLDAAWAEPTTRVLHARGGLIAVRVDRKAELALQPAAGRRTARHLYLGRVEGAAVFADVRGGGEQADDEVMRDDALAWRHPFEFGAELEPTARELMTVALALGNWHVSSGFSPRDGAETEPALGGWARHDPLGGEHFPRTDPAVIVLVEHNNRLLLGSNVLWEADRFSLLAGFVEAGESAEQAVIREVEEEAGVRVDSVRYVASQPWPFPRSLMLGFRASLTAGVNPEKLEPDPEEISELRWFTRDELRNPAPGLQLPSSLSIARWLIDLWVAEGDSDDNARVSTVAGG